MEPRWRKHASPRIVLILAGGFVAAGLLPCLAPVRVQLALLGCLIVVLVVLVMTLAESIWTLTDQADLLPLLLAIAKDSELLELFRRLGASLRDISVNFDPICRDLAVARATQMERELLQVSQGRFIFTGTETWRMAYERLLRSDGLYLYRSIAFLKTANYWQDEPGRQSMQVNFELADEGKLNIERVAIVPDHLWPQHERFPVEPIHSWLQAQHQHNIIVKLVRQSLVSDEPDLITDMGMYGNRAVGQQEIDDRGRTVQFTLSFDFAEILAAEQRWERLSIYAISYAQLLDRSAPGA